MIKYQVELTQAQVRNIIAEHISKLYGVTCLGHQIKFDVKQGYNGEMGGPSYPNEVAVRWEGKR